MNTAITMQEDGNDIIRRNEYLGSPNNMRMAVTSHRRVSLYGSVNISTIRFPDPILGFLKIWYFREEASVSNKTVKMNYQM